MFGSRLNWPFLKKEVASTSALDFENPEPADPCLTPPCPSATANSPFFQQLPAEIRQQILLEAFGHNAIHLHAELEYAEEHFRPPPAAPKRPKSRCECSNTTPPDSNQYLEKPPKGADRTYWKEFVYHNEIKQSTWQVDKGYPTPSEFATNPKFCPHHILRPKERWRIVLGSENTGTPTAGITRTTKQTDHTRPTRWHYSTSFCHRLLSLHHLPQYTNQSSLSSRISPWDDHCLYQPFDPDLTDTNTHQHTPQTCLLGILGFMLSCKQAYLETSPVLYQQNLFHISSDLMFRRLPYILPPKKLCSITTVELIWDLYSSKINDLFCSKHGRKRELASFDQRLDGLAVMMDQLATRMPGLRNVWLCLQSNLLPDRRTSLEVEKVLRVIDKGILGLPHVENARVAFSDIFYHALEALPPTEIPDMCVRRGTMPWMRWWRDLSGGVGKELELEPGRRDRTLSCQNLRKGYWIMCGKGETECYYRANCGL